MGEAEKAAMSEQAVRALMREGLSDDAIAGLTGLSLMTLLEIRATAAVEERPRDRAAPGETATG